MSAKSEMVPTVESAELRLGGGPRATVWPTVIWVGLLLAVAFAPVLKQIYNSWFDPFADMQHGVIVPFVIAYMLYLQRHELLTVESSPKSWGLIVVVWGAIQAWVSTVAQWNFLSRTALIVSLVGCVLFLSGTALLKKLLFPLLLVAFMIPPPTFLYERITLPLQMLASALAEHSLELLGFSVLREGNILELAGERLAVAEACSGIRSLVTLSFFALVYVYFFVPRTRTRLILLLSVVPIAIVGNALRIVITGVVGEYNRELAHSAFHEISGYVIVIMAGVMFVSLHQLLEKVAARRDNRGVSHV
jgi:exosortase